jgi:phosphoribosyl 1,2-cyclic phosphate phosphodiesterase
MRLLFLGTAAAEAYPGVFCGCENCERARASRGRSLRRRSSLLVDDDLLIDLGPDVIAAALAYGLRLQRLRTVLITHVHADHFDADVLRWRAPGFRVGELPELTIYGPPEIAREVGALEDVEELAIKLAPAGPFERFAAHDAEVWTFPARHGTEGPLLYAVERAGAKFLYASDTGAPPEEVWQALGEHRFDVIVMEETMGTAASVGHTNLEEIAAHRARADKEGVLKPGGRFIATHLSHRNNPDHTRLAAMLGTRGIELAHDGMEVIVEGSGERRNAAQPPEQA